MQQIVYKMVQNALLSEIVVMTDDGRCAQNTKKKLRFEAN